jgi:hypothetical protein
VENDDSILCGIELQEIRMEQTTQAGRGSMEGMMIKSLKIIVITIWLFNIAMGKSQFLIGKPL